MMISNFTMLAVLEMAMDVTYFMNAELETPVNNTYHYIAVVSLHQSVFLYVNNSSPTFVTFSAYGVGALHYRDVSGKFFDFHSDGQYLLLEMGPEHSQLQGILQTGWLYRAEYISRQTSFAFGEPGNFAYQVSPY